MEPLRTLLFVPGNKDRMLEKAPGAGADALLYDLEDSVPAPERQTAREKVRAQLEGSSALPRYVRVNGLIDAGPKELETDLQSIAVRGLSGIVLPKAQAREDIEFAAGLLDRLEKVTGIAIGTVEILPMLESARGVMRTYEIANASPRVASVIIGSAEDADLMTDLGCRWSPEGNELLYARSRVLLEARAAGIRHPLDGVFPRINDAGAFVRDCELAKSLGYRGRTVIHPNQIEPANRVFSPTDKEIAYARDMLAAFDAAEVAGTGALSFRGKMIDRAMVRTARELMRRFGE